jgi:hypothetical protein
MCAGKGIEKFLTWELLGAGMWSSEFQKNLTKHSQKFCSACARNGFRILKYRVRPVSGFQFWATRHLILYFFDCASCHLPTSAVNHLTPNGHICGRTAPLNSRRCILFIYSTNIRTEYFKHAAYSPFFPLKNAVYFIMLHFWVPVLFTF